jgi:hypothetical protein
MTIEMAKNTGCKKCVYYRFRYNFDYIPHICTKVENSISDAISGPSSYYSSCREINENLDCPYWTRKLKKIPWYIRIIWSLIRKINQGENK